MNKENNFELDIFLNKRLLRNLYSHNFPPIEERETEIEDKKEHWLKEKIFKIKENTLINNLDSSSLIKLNINLSNIFYFKNYLKIINDFESIDYENFQKMRMDYLKQFFNFKIQDNNEVCQINQSELIRKNESLFIEYLTNNSKCSRKEDLITLVSSLISVVLSSTDEKIILRLLENINVSIGKFYSNESYENSTELEKIFLLLFDTFEIRIFSFLSELNIKFIVEILNKLLYISLRFKSLPLFLLSLYKIKELNLSINNYEKLLSSFFKPKIEDILIAPNKENIFKSFDFSAHNSEVNNFSIISDESFIYISITSRRLNTKEDIFTINLYKLGSGFNNTLLNKVYVHKTLDSIFGIIRVSESENKNEIILLLSNNQSKNLKHLKLNKVDFTLKHEFDLELPSELLYLFNSENKFYFICKDKENENNNENCKVLPKISIFTIKNIKKSIKKLDPSKYKNFIKCISQFYSADQNYISFYNEFLVFFNNSQLIYFMLKLKSFKCQPMVMSDTDLHPARAYFYNKFHNYTLVANLNENKIQIEFIVNKNISPFEKLEFSKKIIKDNKKLLKEIFPSENLSEKKSVTNLLLNKFNTEFYEMNLKFIQDKNLSEIYFTLIYSSLTKLISIFGNLKNSFKKHIEINSNTAYNSIYNKSLYNNLSQEVFKIIWRNISLSKDNLSLHPHILKCDLILINSLSSNLLDINVNLYEYLGDDLIMLTDLLFNIYVNNNLSQEIIDDVIYPLLELIFKNCSFIKNNPRYLEKLLMCLNSDRDLNSKVLYFNLILSNYTRLDLNLIKNVVKLEIQLLEDFPKNSVKESIFEVYEFIQNFKKIFFNCFLSEIYAWNFKSDESLISQIFDLAIENFSTLIEISTKSQAEVEFMNNYSFVTHLTLMFINIITTKSVNNDRDNTQQTEIYSLENFPFHYFAKVINLVIKLDNLSLFHNEKNTCNNLNEKTFLFETEHPCENDLKRVINFKFGNTNEVNCKFDSMSYMNSNSNVIIETSNQNEASTLGPFNTNFPVEDNRITNKDEISILMKHSPYTVPKDSQNSYNYSYGFSFKCSNIKIDHEAGSNSYNIIIDIKRSLIFSICRLIHNTLIDNRILQEKILQPGTGTTSTSGKASASTPASPSTPISIKPLQKETNLYKALFASKLLENISILKMKDLNYYCSGISISNMNKNFIKELQSVIMNIKPCDNSDSKLMINNCLDLIKEYEYDKKHKEGIARNIDISTDNNKSFKLINNIIQSILNNSDQFYKKGIQIMQKILFLKNLHSLTNIGGNREIEHLIIFLFMIILKHENLVFKYNEFLKAINIDGVYDTINLGNFHEINDLDLFLKIFSECSKIRIWFTEKKMNIAESTTVRLNLNNYSDEKETQDFIYNEIDLAISNYIIKISRKAEFILQAININLDEVCYNSEGNILPRKDSIMRTKEYSQHIQDLINNLLVYIKTDEVEIEKIIEKLSVQNEKAIYKETALICFNILLNIIQNSQQDLRDVLYWINKSFKLRDREFTNLSLSASSRIPSPSQMCSLIYFNNDLYGADSVYIERVTVQFYNFISILIRKIQVRSYSSFSLEKSNFELTTSLMIAQILIWKIKKRDYNFLKKSKFFEIFQSGTIFSKCLETDYNYITDESSVTNEEEQYGKECIDLNLLYTSLYQVMMVYSLQVFDKLNYEIAPPDTDRKFAKGTSHMISPRSATTILSLIRKRSEINETESFKIIDRILDIIIFHLKNYINSIGELIKNHQDFTTPPSEEKLNFYLLLLYRGVSFNPLLISYLANRFSDLISICLEIFLLSSDKNKFLIFKFLEIFTIFQFEANLFNSSMTIFKKVIQTRYVDFYSFISETEGEFSQNENEDETSGNTKFYVKFLTKLIISLLNNQNNSKYKFFLSGECDKELAWDLINYMRTILTMKESVIKDAAVKYFKYVLGRRQEFSIAERNLIFIILGVDFSSIRVGCRVVIDAGISDKKIYEIKNIYEYSEEKNIDKLDKRIGVVLGFSHNAKNPFTIDETISELSMDAFSYSPLKKYALVVLEENLTRENVKTLSYDSMIIETDNLVLKKRDLNITVMKEIILQNDIFEMLLRDIINLSKSKSETMNTSEVYIILKLIKNILSSYDEDFFKRLHEFMIKDDVIEVFARLSLSAIDLRMNQITLETLEKNSIEEILLEKDIESQAQSQTQSSSPSELLDKSIAVSIKNKSIFVKYNTNLIREIPTLKIFYMPESTNSTTKIVAQYMNILKFTTTESLLENKIPSILLIECSDLINNFDKLILEEKEICIVGILTNEQFLPTEQCKILTSNLHNVKIFACISDNDFYICSSFLFDQIPNDEFEELFLQSIQRDFSSFIDIPPQMVDESVRFGQRDLVLKIINEETSGSHIEIKNTKENQNSDKSLAKMSKLISLISRRILLICLTQGFNSGNSLEVSQFLKIFKLLIFENNLLNLERNKLESNEIIILVRQYLKGLRTDRDFDSKIISSLMDLSFINKLNYIDNNLISNVDSEKDLLSFENIENNLKIIFSLVDLHNIKNSGESSLHSDFMVKLFHALIIKIDDFMIKSKDTGTFILEVLIILIKYIYECISNDENERMKLVLKNYTFIFKSEEFMRMANHVKEIFEIKDISDLKIDLLDSSMINFFLLYLDLALVMFTRYETDLNLNHFLNSKIMNLYFSYSLLTKKFKSLEFFILFCQIKDVADIKNTSKYSQQIIYDFMYKDSLYEIPHMLKFQYDFSDGINIKIRHPNEKIDIDPNSLIFIYNERECHPYSIQDYYNIEDKNKEIFIKNNNSNKFYISFAYKNFSHNLFGAGSNENQSLGCNGESNSYYGIPQLAQGVTSKNIKSFKFGYYHCFVGSTDDKLFVCGKDYGSSLKEDREFSIYTLENHLNDIVANEGIRNFYVNNYNATILITKTNKFYGCGVNTDGCLSSRANVNSSTYQPFEMAPIPESLPNLKVIKAACGFKASILVLDDGTALTVGCNNYNECGVMDNSQLIREYFHLKPNEGAIVDVCAGEHFFLLLIRDNYGKIRLYSMGSNENGRCGVGSDNSHKLQKCKGVENLEFKQIASRNLSSAAVTKTGELYTFGTNENGNLGLGTNNTDYNRPTIVEALIDYIVDDVSISHNHMLVIARDRIKGVKYIFGAGTNAYGSLCFEDLSLKTRIPKEISYFKSLQKNKIPMRVATSRYQSYILTLESNIQEDKSHFGYECKLCNAYIKDIMYIRSKNPDLEFLCEYCLSTKIGSEIVYMINTPSKNMQNLPHLLSYKELIATINESWTCHGNEDETKTIPDILYINTETFQHDEMNQSYSYQCLDCFHPINSRVFISVEDPNLILCQKCLGDCSNKIDYPQMFYSMSKMRVDKRVKKYLPIINVSKLLWNIVKSESDPFFSIEITPKPSQIEEIRLMSKEKILFELFSKWRKMDDSYLIEFIQLKDEMETQVSPDYNSVINFANTHPEKFSKLKLIDKQEFNLLSELSQSINECIFYLMNLTYNIKEKGFLHHSITDNLSLVSSSARLNIFHERLNKLKVNVNAGEKEMSLSRIKAMKFYEKKVIDSLGENTIFGQLYHKMKKYPVNNYLCKKDNRLFTVTLTGEGATDYGGPYREVLSIACEELHSIHLDLFIKTPNNRNEVGAMRDKFVPNPSSKSALAIDMFYFIGNLIGYAISSGQLLNLNVHPVIWKMILNHSTDFSDYEAIDKLFYKYISNINNFSGGQNEFETLYEQYFMIQLSDGSESELIPGGRKIAVNVENKMKFVNLAKNARMNEFKVQIDSIRYGLVNVIPDNILSILTGKELEELACGTPTLNIDVLKRYTEYQSYDSSDQTIKNFWKVLEGFTNEEKVLYLKYVWGRSRLPDPNIFPFTHIIAKMSISNIPDSRLPAATTCFFTLKLPKYSSLEIMKEKLKYVINNCSEIDADFSVNNTSEF